MHLSFEEKSTGGTLRLIFHEAEFRNSIRPAEQRSLPFLTIAWNRGKAQTAYIDDAPVNIPAHTIVPLVSDQQFCFESPKDVVAWQFNRDFYCIARHDAEVGCAGFLFYANTLLLVEMPPGQRQSLDVVFKMFVEEFNTKDNIQHEMLLVLLKRLIVKITTEARKKYARTTEHFSQDKLDLVRQYNLLVEQHFTTEHEVRFYAGLLNRSPKTLANIFLMLNHESPLKVIHKRIIMEAKRYLYYTDQSAKEIADRLGFEDAANFSRFFKTNTGIAPTDFKNSIKLSQKQIIKQH